MSGLTKDLANASGGVVEQAKPSRAKVSVRVVSLANGTLTTDVTVENETGHRMPSGVGFRRAFLKFTVSSKSTGKELWSAGTTDDRRAILGAIVKPLPSGSLDLHASASHHYQQHP